MISQLDTHAARLPMDVCTVCRFGSRRKLCELVLTPRFYESHPDAI
jgi:hypothetical protein